MKPIFEEERLFLNDLLHINLPTDCWRASSKIFLDCTCKKPIYQFKVDNGIAELTKNNEKLFENYKQKKIKDLLDEYDELINSQINKSINDLYMYFYSPKLNHINDDLFVIGHSSGKDSVVTLHIYILFLLDLFNYNKDDVYNIIKKTDNKFANTSNETADTYKFIKNIINDLKLYFDEFTKNNLVIMNPKEGWTQWLKRKNYFIPTTLTRNCCSTYKEGQINKYYDKNKKITHFIGARKYESTKRQNYRFIMDYEYSTKLFGSCNFPKNWCKSCPIVNWKDEEVWLFILRENLHFNNMYKLGFQRVGCLLCPYQSNYNDLLIQKYYPQRWDWWMNILEKNYINTGVEKRLHWTLEEYKNGKWKTGISKVQELITKKYTEERSLELVKILGISKEMADKYWNRECSCGKKCNPTEIAMFYKLYGRYEGVEDNRQPKCKNCVCEEQEIDKKKYQEMYLSFREQGCNLF